MPTRRGASWRNRGSTTERIAEVTGLADKQLRYPKDPLNPANRRISILLPFLDPPDTPSVEQLQERLENSVKQSS